MQMHRLISIIPFEIQHKHYVAQITSVFFIFNRVAKAGMKKLYDIFDKTSFLKGYDIVDILLVSIKTQQL